MKIKSVSVPVSVYVVCIRFGSAVPRDPGEFRKQAHYFLVRTSQITRLTRPRPSGMCGFRFITDAACFIGVTLIWIIHDVDLHDHGSVNWDDL